MGYTNYWHQHNDITDQNWKVIMTEYKDYVLEVCGDEIKDESTADSIIFQGDCETFKFDKYAKVEKDYPEQDESLHFCKTRQAKYDIYVWYMLMFINKICPGIAINRDYPQVQPMFCIIWKREDEWNLFTNQIFVTEAEALDFGKRSNIKYKKKKVDWKVADAAEWF